MLRAPLSSTRDTEDTEMSLRAFHLLFIAMSVVLAAFCAAWAVGQYRAGHGAMFMMTAVGSIVVAGGLAAYGTAFQRKTRNL
jgi:hypothetical protein